MPKMIVNISFLGKLTRTSINRYAIFFNKKRPYLIQALFINEKKNIPWVGYQLIIFKVIVKKC